MTKSVLKLITAITTGLMLFYFAVPAGAWFLYGECCYWDGEEWHYFDALCSDCCKCGGDCYCMHDHSKCPPCHFCIDCGCENYCEPGEECCDWLCCDEDLCETCVGGDECKVCGGDTSKCCDNGTCVPKCTNTGQCDYGELPSGPYPVCPALQDPITGQCNGAENLICGHVTTIAINDAECADCAPGCAKTRICACAEIIPYRCTTKCILFVCACICDEKYEERTYRGDHYECD